MDSVPWNNVPSVVECCFVVSLPPGGPTSLRSDWMLCALLAPHTGGRAIIALPLSTNVADHVCLEGQLSLAHWQHRFSTRGYFSQIWANTRQREISIGLCVLSEGLCLCPMFIRASS